MQVRIQETTVVRPTTPPFDHDHVLSLSHLDTDRNLHVAFRYFRVYSSEAQHHSDPFHVITSALSAALLHYYPLAGTLRRRSTDGRLELHCRAGDGIPVVTAAVDCKLSFLNYLADSDVDENFVEQLVPDPDPVGDLIRPMTLQLTRFGCGGFVLGTAAHHAVCDGFGATLFFNAVAELARGSGRVSVEPVWDRTSLLGPRSPPCVKFPVHEFLSLDKDFIPYTGSGKRVIKKYFEVKEEWLEQFKRLLQEKSGLKFTTFEALGAFIWRARSRACEQISGEERVTFAYSINIRKLVDPPLPIGYWGNGCVPMYVQLTAHELMDRPIWETINLIRKSKNNVSDEYVKSFIDFQELNFEQGITAGKRVSGFTDWRHLGHSTVDFGWAGPVAVAPLSRHLLGSVETCFFLPGTKEGVIKVLVHLEEENVPAFTREMDKLCNLDDGVL